MELYKEILAHALASHDLVITIPTLKIDAKEIVELECYRALRKIKAIIQDDSLEDSECFMKIEEIILTFEKIGSDGGVRHDFG